MNNDERTRIFEGFKRNTDEELRIQTETSIKTSTPSKRVDTAKSIISFKGKLSQKQRAYLILFIIDHWSKI